MHRSVREALVVAATSMAILATPLTAFAMPTFSFSSARSTPSAQTVRSAGAAMGKAMNTAQPSHGSSATPATGKATDKTQPSRGSSATSATGKAKETVRPRLAADAKVALARDGVREARENFNSRIGYLSYNTGANSDDSLAKATMKSFTEKGARPTFAVEAKTGSMKSGLNTQAVLTAKELVQTVGPERARQFASTLAKTTRGDAKTGAYGVSSRDVQHANLFQKAVAAVIAEGVKR